GHVAGTGDITQHCSHESGVVTGLFLRCLNVEADVFFVAQVFCRVPSPGFDLDTHASAVTQAVKPFIEVFGGLDRTPYVHFNGHTSALQPPAGGCRPQRKPPLRSHELPNGKYSVREPAAASRKP